MAPGRLRILDQTRLPARRVYIDTADIDTVLTAIRTLQVRGAPAIGMAAAMGIAAALQSSSAPSGRELAEEVDRLAGRLAETRPTAVNLFAALERMRTAARACAALGPNDFKERMARAARSLSEEDAAACRAIGCYGAAFLDDGATVLTHCNAGKLAASDPGTALAPVYTAIEQGRNVRVIACETRPLLQGARLTAWELAEAGIDVTVICDNAAARVMQTRNIAAVLVGADRIARNGDCANKIGTYGLALLARAHRIPFYVLAPLTTFDPLCRNGAAIPIEERSGSEITRISGVAIAPAGARVYAPAFDVTPARLITAIVCERGVLRPPYRAAIRSLS